MPPEFWSRAQARSPRVTTPRSTRARNPAPPRAIPGTTCAAFDVYGCALGGTPLRQIGAVPADHVHPGKVMPASLEVTDLIRLYGCDAPAARHPSRMPGRG